MFSRDTENAYARLWENTNPIPNLHNDGNCIFVEKIMPLRIQHKVVFFLLLYLFYLIAAEKWAVITGGGV